MHREICKKYSEGYSVSGLASHYNMSYKKVKAILIDNGVFVQGRITRKTNKDLVVDYFKDIDTPSKAYILGFVMADGCILKTSKQQTRPNRLYIGISARDIEVLEFVKSELKVSSKIVIYKSKKSYSGKEKARIYVDSQQVCLSLERYGIYQNKTGNELIVDELIHNEFIFDFIRGFFDGDGAVVNCKNARHSYFSFSCNKHIGYQISSILKSNGFIGKLSIYKDKRHDDICVLTIARKNDVLRFYDLIYRNDEFCLNRKKEAVRLPK